MILYNTTCCSVTNRIQLFVTSRTAAGQASLSFTISWSLLRFMSIESVMPSKHLVLCRSLSCSQYFSVSSFPVNQLLTSGGQSIGTSASASVLPMNIQDWSPSGWAGWISSQSKGLSRVFSNTTVQKHQFFGAQSSLWSSSHIHMWLLEKPYKYCRVLQYYWSIIMQDDWNKIFKSVLITQES